MTRAAHLLRPADKRRRRKAPPTTPAKAYPPGYFSELVLRHNWPPGFVAQSVEPSRAAELSSLAQLNRQSGKGYEANPLNLPGAMVHIRRWKLP